MPDFPVERQVNSVCISTYSEESIGVLLSGMNIGSQASLVWPSANLAIFVPFTVYEPITIVKMSIINGTAVSGNVDVGIYDGGGAKLVSSGSTAQAGTSVIQTFDITDTLLKPGLYYLALAISNTTGTVESSGTLVAIDAEIIGVMQMASAFALPATATFAAFAQTSVPLIIAHQQAVI